MIGILIALIIALVIIITIIFINTSPQFGGKITEEQKIKYAKLKYYKDGKFINQSTTVMDIKFWNTLSKYLNSPPDRTPKRNIEVEKIDSLTIVNRHSKMSHLTWFGHSTFLLELDNKKILLDPMLGETPAPHPIVGTKRYSKQLPIDIENLPFIDIVIFSHDHYDHLDYKTLQKLKGKVGQYYTPLGVGNHLKKWGVSKEQIHELNWWDEVRIESIKLICTPARHFSGRRFFDRSTTLWSSWVIKGEKDNIYFSGDSGYDSHFKEIGEKYGPFDISLMECGQYNENWSTIHMTPEETVQASIDIKSKLCLPIHWGAFTLSLHSWTDPVERATKKAKELNLPITTPKIGQTIVIGEDYPTARWWTQYN